MNCEREMYSKSKGFTLIELMIVVAIVGILVGVAYPSYTEFVLKSNRSEAQRELLRIGNLQEQRFTDWHAYTTDMTLLGLGASPFITESKSYSISSVTSNNNTSYTLTATAKYQQAKDTSCLTLTLNEAGQKGGTSTNCWE